MDQPQQQTIEPVAADPGRPAGYEEASAEEIETLKALGLTPDAGPEKSAPAPAAAPDKTVLPPPDAVPPPAAPDSLLPPPDAKPPEAAAAPADDAQIQYEHQGRTLFATIKDAREALRQRHGIAALMEEVRGPRDWLEASKVVQDPVQRAKMWEEMKAVAARYRDGDGTPAPASVDPRIDKMQKWIEDTEARRRDVAQQRQMDREYELRVETAQHRLDRTSDFARGLGFELTDQDLLGLARRCRQIHAFALAEKDPARQRQMLDIAEQPLEVWRHDNRDAIKAKWIENARTHETKTLEQVRKGAAVNPPGAAPVSSKPAPTGRKLEEMSNDEQDRLSQADFDLLQADMMRRMGEP